MAKPFGGTVPNKDQSIPLPPDNKKLWMAGNVLGMNSSNDPADIPVEVGVAAINAVSRFDGLERREGYRIETNTKPDSNKILYTHYHKQNDGTTNIWRFTKNSVYRKNSVTWTNYVGALTGGDTDQIRAVSCFDKIVFTNGKDRIQLINIGANTFADLSAFAATKYKYITTFYNRVIGAYDVLNSKPTTIGWSAEYPNIDQWDSSTYPDAGSGPLIDSPNDESDFITQIAGAEEQLFVTRERSIWVGTKQPSASNPFYFRTLIASIGCDCPNSVALIPGGLCWVDTKSGTIWEYDGQQLNRIGLEVEKEVMSAITDTTQVYGCYNQATQEFAVLIVRLDSTSPLLYIYSHRTSKWTRWDGIYNACTVESHPYGNSTKSIDELIGTIDSLTGTIDSLGGTSLVTNPYVFGRNDGEILYTDKQRGYDYNDTTPASPKDFTMQFQSKVFTLPVTDEFLAEIRVYYDCEGSGRLRIYYRKNDDILSIDDTTWTLLKQVTVTPGWQKFIKFTKNIRARTYQFKLEADSNAGAGSGKIRILRYELQNYQAGESKR